MNFRKFSTKRRFGISKFLFEHYTNLIDGIVYTVAWAVRAEGIPADVITLAFPHDIITAGSAYSVESAHYLDHVTWRRASEQHLRYPAATVEALTGRQHRSRCILMYNM